MHINGRPLQDYGAKLLSYSVTPSIKRGVYKPDDSTTFIPLRKQIGLKTISLQIDFFGDSHADIAQRHSLLVAEMLEKSELALPDGYYYNCVLNSCTEPAYQSYFLATSGFEFLGVQHGQEEEIVLNGTNFYCTSTIPETDCVITAKVGANTSSYVVAGITFTNAKAGDTFTIDGYGKRVLVNGVPGLLRCNIKSWPKLKPGWNYIAAPDPITIRYKPTYL